MFSSEVYIVSGPRISDEPRAAEQAHFINNRTMEVFRQLPWHGHAARSAASGCGRGAGGARPGPAAALGSGSGGSLADAVAAASPPLEQWRRFVYCESALGRVLVEMDHFEVRSCLAAGRFGIWQAAASRPLVAVRVLRVLRECRGRVLGKRDLHWNRPQPPAALLERLRGFVCSEGAPGRMLGQLDSCCWCAHGVQADV